MTKHEITQYLENECCFRDYKFHSPYEWGNESIPRSINLFNPDERDLDDALDTFTRDGYSILIIYLGIGRWES